MDAQTLCDLREGTAFCSGTDLHEWFAQQVGDPSPSGDTKIDGDEAMRFIAQKLEDMKCNSPGLFEQTA